MISKELITEAIRLYPQYTEQDECTGNIQYRSGSNVVHFEVNKRSMQQLNTYELAHKCKEWALGKKLQLQSGIHTIAKPKDGYYDKKSVEFNKCTRESYWFAKVKSNVYVTTRLCQHEGYSDFLCYGATEPEAIFQACQWILDNKDKQ